MPIRCAAVFYRINHIIYDQLCPKRNTVHGNRLSLNRNGTACCDAIRKLTATDLACTVCCQLKFTQILYLFRMCFLCGSERIIKGSVLLRCQSHIFAFCRLYDVICLFTGQKQLAFYKSTHITRLHIAPFLTLICKNITKSALRDHTNHACVG